MSCKCRHKEGDYPWCPDHGRDDINMPDTWSEDYKSLWMKLEMAEDRAVWWSRKYKAMKKQWEDEEKDHLDTILHRDHFEESATSLAYLVGDYLGIEFGEHSGSNCPIENAINEIEDRTSTPVVVR